MTKFGKSEACWGALVGAALLFVASGISLGAVVFSGNDGLGRLREGVRLEEARQRASAKEDLESEIAALVATPSLRSAFESLDAGYRAYIPEHLRDLYVSLNPHQAEGLSQLTDPRDGSRYSQAHARHHAWLRDYARSLEFTDLMFVRADGHVIYSLRKGRTFATQVSEVHDDPSARQLAKIVQGVLSNGSAAVAKGRYSLVGEGETLAARAVLDADGTPLGALVVKRDAWAPALHHSAGAVISEVTASWEERVAAASLGLGFAGLFILGVVGYIAFRREGTGSETAFSLIPPQELQLQKDSGRPGSHRSGTRPVLRTDERSDVPIAREG